MQQPPCATLSGAAHCALPQLLLMEDILGLTGSQLFVTLQVLAASKHVELAFQVG